MKNPFASLLLATATLISAAALAHGVVKPRHGGVLGETPSHQHVELVRSDTELVAYLTDPKGQPVPAQGARLEATLLSGTQKSTATFSPAGNNRLVSSTRVAAGAKAVVKLTLPGKATEQFRVTLK